VFDALRSRDVDDEKQLKITQWAIPAVTAVLLVMGANQGEQQRPKSLLSNQLSRVTG